MTKLTVEETNLLSIYKTGSRQGLIVAMNAALPFMDGEMRGFTKPGTGRNVPSAARPLRQALTASNTAPTAGSVSPADRPPSA